MLRTATCGELRADHVGQTVTLCGWADKYRDHGGVVFIDLRDRYGITQIAFRMEESSETQKLASGIRHEDVIQITGEIVSRGDENKNPKLSTGDVELRASELKILNKSKTPPSSRAVNRWRTKN